MFLFSVHCQCGYQTVLRLQYHSTSLTAHCHCCKKEARLTFLQKEELSELSV